MQALFFKEGGNATTPVVDYVRMNKWARESKPEPIIPIRTCTYQFLPASCSSFTLLCPPRNEYLVPTSYGYNKCVSLHSNGSTYEYMYEYGTSWPNKKKTMLVLSVSTPDRSSSSSSHNSAILSSFFPSSLAPQSGSSSHCSCTRIAATAKCYTST